MSLAELRALAAESYDGARQKVWTEPDPAAGADFTITVPGPQFWLPVALTATLTTSDQDADRSAALIVTDGTTTVLSLANGGTVAASAAFTFSWIRDLSSSAGDGDSVLVSLPFPIPTLATGWTIGVVTENIDAGDQWSGIALTAIQITGGQPAQQGRRETAIRDHWQALHELIG